MRTFGVIAKCEIIPVGLVENLEILTSFFGCKVPCLPTTCLGLPLGASFKSVAMWNQVIVGTGGLEETTII